MISNDDRPRRHPFRHAIAIPSWVVALAILMVAASSLLSSVTLTKANDRESARADTASAISNCRSQLATAVTAYTTSYLFAMGQSNAAIGQVVTGLAKGGDLTAPLANVEASVEAIAAAAIPLVDSVNLRLAFEADPTVKCPVLPPTLPTPPSVPATTPDSVVGPPSSTTAPRAIQRPTTTTTRPVMRPASTTSTTFRSSPTTVPPGRLCDLVPFTIPGVPIPCVL